MFLERLGTIYRDQGNNPAAIDTFRQIVAFRRRRQSRNGATRRSSILWREAKEWQKATEAAKEAVQKLPNGRDLKMVLAVSTGRYGRSRQGRSKS